MDPTGFGRAGDSDDGAAALSAAPFDGLLTEVLGRVRTALDEQQRWRLLLDAVVTLAADLSLDDLLARIVGIAADLVGARYAALGVLAPLPQSRLSTFVTYGMPREVVDRIGPPPVGHGLLGEIIDRPEPLRLHDIAAHPQSYGFPDGHPPMSSFLGVPIRTKDKVFGNLYLTERLDGRDFTAQDESIVVALAAAAGVAIENAELHESAERRERWLAATAEITNVLMHDIDDSVDGLQLICDLARQVSGADIATIVSGPDADSLAITVLSTDEPGDLRRGLPLSGESLAAQVVRSGLPMTTENVASTVAEASASTTSDAQRYGPAILVPITIAPESSSRPVVGALTLAWQHENAAAAEHIDVTMPTTFAQQATVALRLSAGRADRQRLALYDDRDRIGRDLHDIVVQRLFAVGLQIQGMLRRTKDSEAAQQLDTIVDELDDAIRDIRRTIFELSVTEHSEDFQAEVTQLVQGAAKSLKFRPRLAFEGPVRLQVDRDLAPDALAVLREALSNVTKHAGATEVSVLVRAADDRLRLRVADNGRGLPDDLIESGLGNLRDRARKHGGECEVGRADPSGTVVDWSIPLPRRAESALDAQADANAR